MCKYKYMKSLNNCVKCGTSETMKGRNYCKACHNHRVNERYKNRKNKNEIKKCVVCNETKKLSEFYGTGAKCKVCEDELRREKYHKNINESRKKNRIKQTINQENAINVRKHKAFLNSTLRKENVKNAVMNINEKDILKIEA